MHEAGHSVLKYVIALWRLRCVCTLQGSSFSSFHQRIVEDPNNVKTHVCLQPVVHAVIQLRLAHIGGGVDFNCVHVLSSVSSTGFSSCL